MLPQPIATNIVPQQPAPEKDSPLPILLNTFHIDNLGGKEAHRSNLPDSIVTAVDTSLSTVIAVVDSWFLFF